MMIIVPSHLIPELLLGYLMTFLPLLHRPDHLSCHVKHVHSSERPFKCQVTVRLRRFSLCSYLFQTTNLTTISVTGTCVKVPGWHDPVYSKADLLNLLERD